MYEIEIYLSNGERFETITSDTVDDITGKLEERYLKRAKRHRCTVAANTKIEGAYYMPTLNFKAKFEKPIADGKKRQTIRKQWTRPIKAGDTLYLYTGLRTKKTKLIKEVKCEKVVPIVIEKNQYTLEGDTVFQDAQRLKTFAKRDGFATWNEFVSFFEENYGLPFKGVVIVW